MRDKDNELGPRPATDTAEVDQLLAVLKGLLGAVALLGQVFRRLTWPTILGLLAGAAAWHFFGFSTWPARAAVLALAGVGAQLGDVVQHHWRRLLPGVGSRPGRASHGLLVRRSAQPAPPRLPGEQEASA